MGDLTSILFTFNLAGGASPGSSSVSHGSPRCRGKYTDSVSKLTDGGSVKWRCCVTHSDCVVSATDSGLMTAKLITGMIFLQVWEEEGENKEEEEGKEEDEEEKIRCIAAGSTEVNERKV
ncbi:hypothetical protein E2C01_044414 [Portunus trituberculatus]|uniref:Uncharacterized protein n=1 Tax=Portunus trituberculatus TaxID=210409 RepID=A0A5B7FYE2_PORTR|nr:hypothetical protein [Portunus trituberculatus]